MFVNATLNLKKAGYNEMTKAILDGIRFSFSTVHNFSNKDWFSKSVLFFVKTDEKRFYVLNMEII